jgi:protein associated with RNAse G/E
MIYVLWIMHYPEDIDHIVNKELENLIEMKKNNEGPFNTELIEQYHQKYKEIAAK